MIADFSPGVILIVGGLLLPLVPRPARGFAMIALPVLACAYLLTLPMGESGKFVLMGLELTTLRLDKLSYVFTLIFLVAAALAAVYSLYEKDLVQQVAGMVYAGSAVGAVLAGDLVTLFFFWEGTAISSVFLIWASRNERAYHAGMRYLLIQVGSGVLLLAGVMMHYRATGSIAFGALGLDGSTGKLLIFLAFGIKCAFPLMHNWLPDAYPEATVSGTVVLSAFTTKLAVYSLARGYAGTEILVPIGAVMALFPIVYAAIENDLRRVLAYSLNNQLGFMVVGIGIGTELALNGTTAHAVCSVLYKSLLFMALGAVLLRAGTAKASELGGLFKSMPWTAGFCIVGAASISSVPLLSGFVSKSMIVSAAMEGGHFWTWMVLVLASAGVFYQFGIRIPFAAFFARGSGKRCDEAPASMIVAMALTAALCVGIGVYPDPLYALLPFKVSYAPFTLDHVASQLQILVFAALAFVVLTRAGVSPQDLRATNLDTDWVYRKLGYDALAYAAAGVSVMSRQTTAVLGRWWISIRNATERHHASDGAMSRAWPTGTMAFWTTVILGAYLLISYL